MAFAVFGEGSSYGCKHFWIHIVVVLDLLRLPCYGDRILRFWQPKLKKHGQRDDRSTATSLSF